MEHVASAADVECSALVNLQQDLLHGRTRTQEHL